MVATAYGLYWLARRLGGPEAGLAAVFLWALWAPLTRNYQNGFTDAPFLALVLLSLVCAARAGERAPRRPGAWMAAAGLLMGLATCVRYLGGPLLVALLVVAALRVLRAPAAARRAPVCGLLTLAAAGLPPVVPWLVRNVLVVGSLLGSYSTTGHVHLISNFLVLPSALMEGFGLLLGLTVVVVFLAGLSLSPASAPWRRPPDGSLDPDDTPWLLALVVLAYMAALVVFTGTFTLDRIGPRYMEPIAAVLFIAAAAIAARSASPTRRQTHLGLALMALLMVAQGAHLVQFERYKGPALAQWAAQTRPITDWVSGHTERGDLIIDYSGARVRERTGRPVIEQVEPVSPPVTPAAVRAFFQRLGRRFPRAYLLEPLPATGDLPAYVRGMTASYGAGGVHVEFLATLPASPRSIAVWRLSPE